MEREERFIVVCLFYCMYCMSVVRPVLKEERHTKEVMVGHWNTYAALVTELARGAHRMMVFHGP